MVPLSCRSGWMVPLIFLLEHFPIWFNTNCLNKYRISYKIHLTLHINVQYGQICMRVVPLDRKINCVIGVFFDFSLLNIFGTQSTEPRYAKNKNPTSCIWNIFQSNTNYLETQNLKFILHINIYSPVRSAWYHWIGKNKLGYLFFTLEYIWYTKF